MSKCIICGNITDNYYTCNCMIGKINIKPVTNLQPTHILCFKDDQLHQIWHCHNTGVAELRPVPQYDEEFRKKYGL